MSHITTNTSKQSLFDSVLVLAKAKSRDEYCVVYENKGIRNLNFLEKIKNTFFNLFNNEKEKKLSIESKFSAAKVNVNEKLGNILFEKINKKADDKYGNVVTEFYLSNKIAANFLDKKILNNHEKINQPASISPQPEQPQEDQNLDNLANKSFGHLPILIKAVLDDPSLEKFVTILVNDSYTNISMEKINPTKLITMAKQASLIKEKLRCDSKKAIGYVKKLGIDESKNEIHSSQLNDRVKFFVQAKKKYNLNDKFAENYALLTENKLFKNCGLTEKQILDVVHSYFKNKINENVNKDELLDQIIKKYA